MKVTDMVKNFEKAKCENLYLAEKKYSLHKTGLSFQQIRNSLNTQYGGFDMDGKYYQKNFMYRSIDHSPNPKKSPPKISPQRSTMESVISNKMGNLNFLKKRNNRRKPNLQIKPTNTTSDKDKKGYPQIRSSLTRNYQPTIVKNMNISDLCKNVKTRGSIQYTQKKNSLEL